MDEHDAEDDTNESVRSVNSLHEEDDDSQDEEDDDGQDEWDSPGDEVGANDSTVGEIDDESVELMDYNEEEI